MHTRLRLGALGFSLRLEITASGGGWGVGVQADGFPLALGQLRALGLRAGRLGAPGTHWTSAFLPTLPLTPDLLLGGRVCVRAGPSLGFLFLFVPGAGGGWEGFSC